MLLALDIVDFFELLGRQPELARVIHEEARPPARARRAGARGAAGDDRPRQRGGIVMARGHFAPAEFALELAPTDQQEDRRCQQNPRSSPLRSITSIPSWRRISRGSTRSRRACAGPAESPERLYDLGGLAPQGDGRGRDRLPGAVARRAVAAEDRRRDLRCGWPRASTTGCTRPCKRIPTASPRSRRCRPPTPRPPPTSWSAPSPSSASRAR